jgi:hypothetical protein
LTAAVAASLLSRNLRLENQRMRGAINNMSQVFACSTATSAWPFAIAATCKTGLSAESVLTESQAVEVAAGALRKEVEGFLSRVAA